MAACQQVQRGQPVHRKEDCSSFDIGVVFKELISFSDAQKLELIEKIWKPDDKFDFPQSVESKKNRKFREDWLRKYPWLAYSKYLDGAFCLPCVLFSVGNLKTDKLVKSPLVC